MQAKKLPYSKIYRPEFKKIIVLSQRYNDKPKYYNKLFPSLMVLPSYKESRLYTKFIESILDTELKMIELGKEYKIK